MVHLLQIVFGDRNEKLLLRKAPYDLDLIIEQGSSVTVTSMNEYGSYEDLPAINVSITF